MKKEKTYHVVQPRQLLENGDDFVMFDFRKDDFKDKLYYSVFNPDIVYAILQFAKENKNNLEYAGNTLAGCIRMNEWYIHDVMPKDLYVAYVEELKHHISVAMGRDIRNLMLDSSWINFMQSQEYNPIHTHTEGKGYSFVLYADIPKEIEMDCYKNAAKDHIQKNGVIDFIGWDEGLTSYSFSPQTNDFFLFHASRPHMVYPYYANAERISISGNISYVS